MRLFRMFLSTLSPSAAPVFEPAEPAAIPPMIATETIPSTRTAGIAGTSAVATATMTPVATPARAPKAHPVRRPSSRGWVLFEPHLGQAGGAPRNDNSERKPSSTSPYLSGSFMTLSSTRLAGLRRLIQRRTDQDAKDKNDGKGCQVLHGRADSWEHSFSFDGWEMKTTRKKAPSDETLGAFRKCVTDCCLVSLRRCRNSSPKEQYMTGIK